MFIRVLVNKVIAFLVILVLLAGVVYEWPIIVDAAPTQFAPFNIALGGAIRAYELVDFDGDGDLDIVAADLASPAELVWYENTGGNSFSVNTLLPSLRSTVIDVADMNGDGIVDVVADNIITGEVKWFEHDGSGNIVSSTTIIAAAESLTPIRLFVVDVDGDGAPDVLSGERNAENIYLHKNDGSNNFTTEIFYPSLATFQFNLDSGDFNGDGATDVIFVSNDEGILQFQNNGDGSFTTSIIDNGVSNASGVAIGDINGDGIDDIVVAAISNASIYWYAGDGAGNFGSRNTAATALTVVQSVAVADIDGDGDTDVIGGTTSSQESLTWYKNLGDGTFDTTEYRLTTSVTLWDHQVGDINNDGRIDVVARSNNGDIFRGWQNNVEADTTAPSVVSTNPADESMTAPTNGLTVTFDEFVYRDVSTSTLFSVYEVGTDRLVETLGTADVTGYGSITLTLTLDQDLAGDESFYVLTEGGILRDDANNFYAGENDVTAWNFTTEDLVVADPSQVIFTPADNETDVSIHTDLTMQFPENMNKVGSGFIRIHNLDTTAVVASYEISSDLISGDGTPTITIAAPNTLESSTEYVVSVAPGILADDAGNTFAGFTTGSSVWSFTTEDVTGPVLVSTNPVDDATDAQAVDQVISLTFDEDILLRSGDFTIHNADGSVFETIAATGGRVTGNESATVSLYPSQDFAYNTAYYVTVPAGVVTDLSGNAFAGITSTTTFNFTTAIPSAAEAAANGDIIIDFDQPVEKGTGNLTIYRASDGSVHEVIDVTTNQVTLNNGTSGVQAIISPTNELDSEQNYYLIADAGAFVFVSNGQPVPENTAVELRFTAPDETDPVLVTAALQPADNATAVPVDQVLRLTFSEPVVRGSGFISVYDDTGNEVLADISISNTEQLIGAEESPVLSVYLSEVLPFSSDIHVEYDAGLVEDLAGNKIAAVTNSTTWNFTTVSQASSTYQASVGDANALPIIDRLTPSNREVDVSTTTRLTVQFSEPVFPGTGNLSLYTVASGTLIEQVAVGDAATQLTPNTRAMSVALSSPLATSTEYYVLLDAGIVVDSAGDAFAGIDNNTTWRFETSVTNVPVSQAGPDATAPTIADLSPADNAVDVATTTNLAVTFSESVYIGSGAVRIYEAATDTLLETIAVTSGQVTGGSGSPLLGIRPSATLSSDRGYYIQLDSGLVTDAAGNAFAGTDGSTTRWNFQTAAIPVVNLSTNSGAGGSDGGGSGADAPDTTGPQTTALYPRNGQENVAISTAFNMLFNEEIVRQSGSLRLYLASDDTLLETISVTDSGQVSIGANRPSLSFTPSTALATSTEYYLTVDAGIVADALDNDFIGLTGSSSWRFTTQAATSSSPTPQSVVPQFDPETGYIISLTLVFSEPMNPGSGSMTIYRSGDNTQIERIPLGSSQITGFGTNLVTVTPSEPLPDTSGYYLNLSLNALVAVDDGEATPAIEDEESLAVAAPEEDTSDESEVETDGRGSTSASRSAISSDPSILGVDKNIAKPRCYALLQSFLSTDQPNERLEVLKFQAFLAADTNITTSVSGIFDPLTKQAAQAFQIMYADDVLAPWGYDESDAPGRVYITTKRKVNELFCDYTGSPDTTFPYTPAEQQEIDTYRAR